MRVPMEERPESCGASWLRGIRPGPEGAVNSHSFRGLKPPAPSGKTTSGAKAQDYFVAFATVRVKTLTYQPCPNAKQKKQMQDLLGKMTFIPRSQKRDLGHPHSAAVFRSLKAPAPSVGLSTRRHK
jgi:hypothetical protein